MVFDTEFRQILDVSTGQPRTLHQHVSLLLSRFAFQMINHVHLVNVGGKHVYLRMIKAKVRTLGTWHKEIPDTIKTATYAYFYSNMPI